MGRRGEREGDLGRIEAKFLGGENILRGFFCEFVYAEELGMFERFAFCGELEFDDISFLGEDDGGVGVCARIFAVIEVDKELSFYESDGNGGDVMREGRGGQESRADESIEGLLQGDEGAIEGGLSCSAVCDEDVAIEDELTFSEGVKVGDGA